MRQSFNKRN